MKKRTVAPAAARLLVTVMMVLTVCACGGGGKGGDADNSLQITEDDIVQLEGSIFDAMVMSWEPVFLEDSEQALLGEVTEVRYDDGLFFVLSQTGLTEDRSLLVFDSVGRFRNRISNMGRARNEYVYMNCWALDPVRNEVVLFDDFSLSPKYFDYAGKYLRTLNAGRDDDEHDIYMAVCLHDGTLKLENEMTTHVVDECLLIHPDGSVRPLFESRGYKLAPHEVAGDYYMANPKAYSDPAGGVWFMRQLDNHIYRMKEGDSVECVANLSFKDEVAEEVKRDLPFNGYLEHFADIYYNLKDYLLIEYGSVFQPVMFDKTASKLYRGEDVSENLNDKPPVFARGCTGNAIIGIVQPAYAVQMDSVLCRPDAEDVSEKVREFYHRAARSDNPTLVVFHFKDPAELAERR